jgi:hypothetical protein
MNLDEMIKRLGVINTGLGMKIIMKNDATERQLELAKKFYPDATVIKEVKEEYIDYSDIFEGFEKCFSFDQFEEKLNLDFFVENEANEYKEEEEQNEKLDTPLYYEVAA